MHNGQRWVGTAAHSPGGKPPMQELKVLVGEASDLVLIQILWVSSHIKLSQN